MRALTRERLVVAIVGGFIFGFAATLSSIAARFNEIDTHSLGVTSAWVLGFIVLYRKSDLMLYCCFGTQMSWRRPHPSDGDDDHIFD